MSTEDVGQGGGAVEPLDWIYGQVASLCEDTEQRYRDIGMRDQETKEGAFARGRMIEAKSIRNAICEVIRERRARSGAASAHAIHPGCTVTLDGGGIGLVIATWEGCAWVRRLRGREPAGEPFTVPFDRLSLRRA